MKYKQSARERGYTYAWTKARNRFIMQNPVCVMCKNAGYLTPAEVVDHIIPHKGDHTLFWDESNWQSLCKRHHDSDKQRAERSGVERQAVGLDGWPEGWGTLKV